MLKSFLPLALFCLLGILLWQGLGKDPTRLPSPLIDRPIPNFSLPDLLNPEQQVSNTELLGKPYLINVWGSWCPECRVEHPLISALADQLPVYGLNWKDTKPEATRWLEQFGNPYHAVPFDEDGRVGIELGVYGAPETLLVDAQGLVRFKHVGPLDNQVIQQQLLPALRSLP